MKKVDMKKYKLVGTMRDDMGNMKIRFVNNDSNLVTYKTKGNTDGVIWYFETPLTKVEAVKFLLTHDHFQTDPQQAVLKEYLEKNEKDYLNAIAAQSQEIEKTVQHEECSNEETLPDLQEYLEMA